MTKHTPGPWDCIEATEGEAGPISVLQEGFDAYAPDDSSLWPNKGYDIAQCFGPEREANARLIAAAPELLAAVLHCEEMLMRYEINRINGEEIADEALTLLRAAKTKAIGEQA